MEKDIRYGNFTEKTQMLRIMSFCLGWGDQKASELIKTCYMIDPQATYDFFIKTVRMVPNVILGDIQDNTDMDYYFGLGEKKKD